MRARFAVLKTPPKFSVSSLLPLYKNSAILTHSESALLQVLIPLNFNSRIINTCKKPGGGTPPCTGKVLQLVTPNAQPIRPCRTCPASPATHHSLALSRAEGSLAIIPFRIRTSEKLARNSFRIRTSKTGHLKSFRICTYEEPRGVGAYLSGQGCDPPLVPSLRVSANSAPLRYLFSSPITRTSATPTNLSAPP